MSQAHMLGMVRHPEQALCRDLPSIIFFSSDDDKNHTVKITGKNLRACKSKTWKTVTARDVLAVLGRHFMAVIDHTRQTAADELSVVELFLATEYAKCAMSKQDIEVSRYCPIYQFLEGGVLSVSKMETELERTIVHCMSCPQEKWMRAHDYMVEML
jgi:hypothetical protein